MPKNKNIYYISRAKTNSKNISFKRNSTYLGAVRLRLDGDEAHQGLHSAVRPHNGVASGFTKTGEAVKALQGADEQVNVVQWQVVDQLVIDSGRLFRQHGLDNVFIRFEQAQFVENVQWRDHLKEIYVYWYIKSNEKQDVFF